MSNDRNLLETSHFTVKASAVLSHWRVGAEGSVSNDIEPTIGVSGAAYQQMSGWTDHEDRVGNADISFVQTPSDGKRVMHAMQFEDGQCLTVIVELSPENFMSLTSTLAASGDGNVWVNVYYDKTILIPELFNLSVDQRTNIEVTSISIHKSRKPGG